MTLDMVRDRISAPETEKRNELIKTVRNITLTDGKTKPYQFATIKIVTLEPEELKNFGAIALYAVKDRLDKTDDLNFQCQKEFGKPLNEIDGLYQFSDGKVVAPPLVETFAGFGQKVSPENSNIVDGLHRFIDCDEENKPLTVVEVSNINQKFRLPFKSFSILDVAVTDNIPETKRILSDPAIDPDIVTNLYRNLGPLGSHHRDQSYPLLPLIPWELHQINRTKFKLEEWQKLIKDLKDYVPPLPSIYSRPPIKVMINDDSYEEIFNKDSNFAGFRSIVPAEGTYSVGKFDAYYFIRDVPSGRPTTGGGGGEALLVNKEYWQKTCTKLVTVVLPESVPDFEKISLSNFKLKSISPSNVQEIKYSYKDDFSGNKSRFSFTKFPSPNESDRYFIVLNSPKTKTDLSPKKLEVISTVDQDNSILLLDSNFLFGVNSFGVAWEYYSTKNFRHILTDNSSTGPTLLIGSDFLLPIELSLCNTVEKYPDVFPQIIDKIENTQWYNPSFKFEEYTKELGWANHVVGIENLLNKRTERVGQVSNHQLLNLFRSGLLPDPKTITAISTSLLHLNKLSLNPTFLEQLLILEKKDTPFGVIFVPPSLPLDEAKMANSMKFPSRKDRMDMSFTLTQTNAHKLESRTSTDQLCQIKLSDFVKTLSTSNDFLPFDMESLAHIFSSLIQIGALELKK